MPYKVYINGKLVPEESATISVFDRSYLYGEGAFEVIRAYKGVPAFCDMHYHRLKTNCEKLAIDLPLDEYSFQHAVVKTINANRLREAYVRLTVSPVGASMGLARPAKLGTNFVIFAKPFKGRPREVYERGARIIVVEGVFADDPDIAEIKSTNYLSRMLARMEVTNKRADEGLMQDRKGLILEGTATNLFVVVGNSVFTPPLEDGCLPGITRFVVMGLAENLKIPCAEKSLTVNDIKDADELFLTGTTSEVMPVREVAGLARKDSAPGQTTLQLMEAYKKMVTS